MVSPRRLPTRWSVDQLFRAHHDDVSHHVRDHGGLESSSPIQEPSDESEQRVGRDDVDDQWHRERGRQKTRDRQMAKTEDDCRSFLEKKSAKRREFSIFTATGEHLGGANLRGDGAFETELWIRGDRRGSGFGTEALKALANLRM